ncbi:MAG: metallophosphoesterase family protein [Candidatus Njordarchaeales archaeon]
MPKRYRILVTGDFHIPFRAQAIPKQLLETLEEDIFDLVAITGDLVQSYVLEPFKKFPIVAVRGNMDIGEAARFPEIAYIDIPGSKLKAIIFHGTGIYPRGEPMLLRGLAKKHGANIIFTGHTHYPDVRKVLDTLIINPGSGTGVYGGGGGFGTPTWAIVEIASSDIFVEIYAVRKSYIEIIARKKFVLEEE